MAAFIGIDFLGHNCKVAFVLDPNVHWDATSQNRPTEGTEETMNRRLAFVFSDNAIFRDVDLNVFKHLVGRKDSNFGFEVYAKDMAFINSAASLSFESNIEGEIGLKLLLNDSDSTIVVPSTYLLALIFRRLYNTIADFCALKNSTKAIRHFQPVITIPDYFDADQQEAVLQAASFAGFAHIGLLRGSTAACAAYQSLYTPHRFVKTSVEDTVIFVDIGHSTSTVVLAVVTYENMTVLGHKSNTSLGTRDMDMALATHFGREIMTIHDVDILSVPYAHSCLIRECSKARDRLIFSKEASLGVSLFQFNLEHRTSVNLETFQTIISSLIDDTLSLIQDTLIKVRPTHAAVRTVVLLGDAAPLFKPRIMDRFPGAIARSLEDFSRAKTALKGSTLLRSPAIGNSLEFWIEHALERSIIAWKKWDKGEVNIENIASRIHGLKISAQEERGNNSELVLEKDKDYRYMEPLTPNVTSTVLGSTVNVPQIDDKIKELIAILETTVDSDARRPEKCNSLCGLYLEKYSYIKDIHHVNNALLWGVTSLGNVDYRSPDARPEFLSNVATCLKYQYDHSKDLQTLNMSILYQSYVINALPLDDATPANASYLINYGTFLQTRGEHLGNSSDLVDGAKYLQRAISLLTKSGDPAEQPHLIAAVINLGNTLQILYRSTGTLDDLYNTIHCHEIALSLLRNKDAERSAALSRMGFAMLLHHQHFGNVDDVNKALRYFQEAVEYVSDEHPSKPLYLSGYANALTALYRYSQKVETINRAIEIQSKIVDLRKHDHPSKAMDTDRLGSLYANRFTSTDDLSDLDEAVKLHRSALALTKEDQLTQRFTILNNLGTSLKTRFSSSRDREDSVQCISTLEHALDYAEFGAARARAIYNLADAYFGLHNFGKDDIQRLKCMELCKEVVSSLAPLTVRFHAAGLWTQAAILSTNGQEAQEATTTMVDLLSQLAWPGLSLSSQISVLRFANQAACNAAAIALHFKDPFRALEWLEQGRTVSWNQLLHVRSPLLELKTHEPELANEIIELSRRLDLGERRTEVYLEEREEGSKSLTFTKNEIALKRDKLLQKARAIPGFERLMMAKKYSDFHIRSYDGPVVVVNVSQYRCDALIISRGRAPFHLPLETFSLQQAEYLKTRMLKSLQNSAKLQRHAKIAENEIVISDAGPDGMRYGRPRRDRPTNESIDADFRYILKELFEHVVQPIMFCLGLGIEFDEDLPHIWWCLTGPLTFLPLHAAGIYAAENDHETARISILDYAVSSYIPNISALHNIMHKEERPPFKMLSVIQSNTPGQQPLPATLLELEIIRKYGQKAGLSGDMNVLQGEAASCAAVVEGMKNHSWIHLACHGKQDVHEPTKSGLHLHDNTLLFEDIVKVSLPGADFAFLSACQTATGDVSHPDEAVHLAAGMLIAGYNSVIASMWSIGDNDASSVAKDVYDYLFEEGQVPDSRKAARALHRAVRNLRTRHTGRHGGSSFLAWLPYIHVGM